MKGRRIAGRAHRVLISTVALGVVVQFYASWLLLGGRPTVHAVVGWILIPLTLLAALVALVAHGWRHPRFLVTLAVLPFLILQPVIALSLAPISVYLGALHPVNGLLVYTLLLWQWLPTDGRS